MQQYINNFLRYWWMFLIILLISPVVQILTMRPIFNYTVRASLWVEQSLYSEENPYQPLDPEASAAKSNTQLLSLLLASPSFQSAITTKVADNGYKLNDQAVIELKTAIFRGVKVNTKGPTLIQLEYEDRDDHLAIAVLKGTIEAYNEFVLNILQTRGKSSIRYLENQVNALTNDLDRANAKLKDFLNSNPNVKDNDPLNIIPFLSQEDFTYSLLQTNQQQLQRQYEMLNNQLDLLRINLNALVSGKTSLITVKDPPGIVSSFTYDNTFRLVLSGGVGLLSGLLFTILAVMLVSWWNSSLQDDKKAKAILEVGFVVALPMQKPAASMKSMKLSRRKKV